MSDRNAVVFGAGKIARGFIAHLLTLSGYRITFVEKNPELVESLRRRGAYGVQILGAPEKDITITGFEVLGSDEAEEIAARVASAQVVFVSVGGPHLAEIAPRLAEGIRRAAAQGRVEPLNVILCENYFQPAKWLREMIHGELGAEDAGWFERRVGIVETMVLRSTIEPTEEMKARDPLSLSAQDMWEMPADQAGFVGPAPEIRGLAPKEGFQAGLVRKLFTYNAVNAVVCYTGYLRGYRLLSEAANDAEVAALARAAGEESSAALCQVYGFDPQEQRKFAEAALAKYQKREIVDPIERNARDPLRKLGRQDRLVGPACLAAERGITPAALSRGIAAALWYDQPRDPSAARMQAMIAELGVSEALREVCGIDPAGVVGRLVMEAWRAIGEERAREGIPA